MGASDPAPSLFQRILLPGLAFKAVVIGGGYATGREIAEFFLGSGPRGGLMGLLLAMAIWSLACVATFLLAERLRAFEYRAFFRALLGPFWVVFEAVYILLMILILSVMAAAAGSIGETFGMDFAIGSGALILLIVGVTAAGTKAAERMFRFSSGLIYTVYALFIALALASFGEQIGPAMARPVPTDGWVVGGATYAGYNLIAAVAILPFLRHLRGPRDAVAAGLLSGPLAMLPALLFFLAMVAFHPEIADATLPSDFLLGRIGLPWLTIAFQAMIFVALLETGVGMVNAINERIGASLARRNAAFPWPARLAVSLVLVLGSAVFAARYGLVDLIARGYGAFGWIMLAVFVLPLATIGVARLLSSRADDIAGHDDFLGRGLENA